MRHDSVVVGGLAKHVSLAIKVQLAKGASSLPKLLTAMPPDSLGRPYSYRRMMRKISGESRMTLDDLEAFCVGLEAVCPGLRIRPDELIARPVGDDELVGEPDNVGQAA